MDYREEVKELREKLNRNVYLYDVMDTPTMPDYEYDQLNRRLEELETAHLGKVTVDSPTQRFGNRILKGFTPYTNAVPLESLQDIFNAKEVAEFCGRVSEVLGTNHVKYSMEPKVDDNYISLDYIPDHISKLKKLGNKPLCNFV